jgi:SOS-response transcriptional repressor LexA
MTFDYKLFKEWPERVKLRMKELSLTQEMLAKQMEVTRGAIAHYLGGRRVPPTKQFQKLARILQTDPVWLQYGIDPAKDPEAAKAYKKEMDPLNPITPIPILTWKLIAETADLEELDKIQRKIEYLPHLYTDELGHYAVRVKGDAMTATSGHMTSFREGDIVQVDQAAHPRHNDYVVVVLPDATEATFRQFIVEGGEKYLKPINPQYPLIQVSDDTRFCGVAIYHIASNNLK